MLKKQIIYTVLFISAVYPQSKNPDEILENVKKVFEKVKDYEVDVNIKVDVEFLKMPERKAKIYFKQPDKFHIESDGFAVLPKQGLNFSQMGFLESKYSAFYEKETELKGINTSVIKVIPLSENSDVILTTLWIDQERNLVMKVESSRKPSGTFSMEFNYVRITGGFLLPDSMVFNFTIDKMMIPGKFTDDNEKEEGNKESDEPKTGKVYLTYSNYKVNQELPDSIFTKNSE